MIKRGFDICVSLLALPLVAPVLLVVALLIARNLGFPILFTQPRTGMGGTEFRIYKLRTMTNAMNEAGHLLPAEQRLTPFGRVLRATAVDELPQLWNVLRGEMSLVGPRPQLSQYTAHFSPRQRRRLEVRPGITGLAQVAGRNRLSWEQRFELDVEYVERHTIWLDLRILYRTLLTLAKRGADAETDDGPIMPDFEGSVGETRCDDAETERSAARDQRVGTGTSPR